MKNKDMHSYLLKLWAYQLFIYAVQDSLFLSPHPDPPLQ